MLELIFGDFNAGTIREAVFTWLGMLAIEIVIAVPTYFFLKKHPKAKKKKVEFWMTVGLLAVLVVALVIVKLMK